MLKVSIKMVPPASSSAPPGETDSDSAGVLGDDRLVYTYPEVTTEEVQADETDSTRSPSSTTSTPSTSSGLDSEAEANLHFEQMGYGLGARARRRAASSIHSRDCAVAGSGGVVARGNAAYNAPMKASITKIETDRSAVDNTIKNTCTTLRNGVGGVVKKHNFKSNKRWKTVDNKHTTRVFRNKVIANKLDNAQVIANKNQMAAGDIFELHQKATVTINGKIEGIETNVEHLLSLETNSVDIHAHTDNTKYQLKAGAKAKNTYEAYVAGEYPDQKLVVPADQVADVGKRLDTSKSGKLKINGKPEVCSGVTDNGVSSDPITTAELDKIVQEARLEVKPQVEPPSSTNPPQSTEPPNPTEPPKPTEPSAPSEDPTPPKTAPKETEIDKLEKKKIEAHKKKMESEVALEKAKMTRKKIGKELLKAIVMGCAAAVVHKIIDHLVPKYKAGQLSLKKAGADVLALLGETALKTAGSGGVPAVIAVICEEYAPKLCTALPVAVLFIQVFVGWYKECGRQEISLVSTQSAKIFGQTLVQSGVQFGVGFAAGTLGFAVGGPVGAFVLGILASYAATYLMDGSTSLWSRIRGTRPFEITLTLLEASPQLKDEMVGYLYGRWSWWKCPTQRDAPPGDWHQLKKKIDKLVREKSRAWHPDKTDDVDLHARFTDRLNRRDDLLKELRRLYEKTFPNEARMSRDEVVEPTLLAIDEV